MKLDKIPAPLLTANVSMLAPYAPGLTPTGLVEALRAYGEPPASRGSRNDPPARMLSLDEAAAVLGVSTCTTRRMVKDGRLPGKRVGGQWRVPMGAIKALATAEV
jgi:excisionase family DNA binding protein